MLQQQPIGRSVNFSGMGLHSGNRVNMTISPAPANSGVRFCNVKVHTVEHVLAALAGFGIDNAVIELDANEPPCQL